MMQCLTCSLKYCLKFNTAKWKILRRRWSWNQSPIQWLLSFYNIHLEKVKVWLQMSSYSILYSKSTQTQERSCKKILDFVKKQPSFFQKYQKQHVFIAIYLKFYPTFYCMKDSGYSIYHQFILNFNPNLYNQINSQKMKTRSYLRRV